MVFTSYISMIWAITEHYVTIAILTQSLSIKYHKTKIVIRILLLIQDIPGSILAPEFGYPNYGVKWFSSDPSRKHCTVKHVTSIHILPVRLS
jgi:hypothetical protein